MKYMAPYYYGYWRYKEGGYSSITKCCECGVIALHEDNYSICKLCGGKVVSHGAGKWIFPTFKFNWRKLRKEQVTEGYWLLAKD